MGLAPTAVATHYSYSVVRGCDRIVPVTCTCPAVRPRRRHCSTASLQLQNKIRRTNTIARA